jgi:ribosomal protein S18 acetylase RimI-like enzyme
MMLSVVPLDASGREDFYRVHSESNCAGWCHCVAWWVRTWDGWGQRTAEQNRALREKLFRQGRYDGYLMYVDGQPAGWCQCGPRDRLPKLVEQFKLNPDPGVWAITCVLISPQFRKQGLANYLLDKVLTDLATRGVPRVQAFPRRGQNLPDEDVWTGPEALFKTAGFTLERDDPRKPIYCKQLQYNSM